MILGNETGVFLTTPLQLDEESIHLVKECVDPSSERAALNDPGLYQKKGYITLTGEVDSLSPVQQTEGDFPVRDVEIKEDGVKKKVSLQKEAATVPLQPGQMIKITHVKSNTQENKFTSSEFTVVSPAVEEPAVEEPASNNIPLHLMGEHASPAERQPLVTDQFLPVTDSDPLLHK
ncbi:hypothetical protein MHYP_G00219030 [Metynnis hypsauchen]